jgi:hypothetical protein
MIAALVVPIALLLFALAAAVRVDIIAGTDAGGPQELDRAA